VHQKNSSFPDKTKLLQKAEPQIQPIKSLSKLFAVVVDAERGLVGELFFEGINCSNIDMF